MYVKFIAIVATVVSGVLLWVLLFTGLDLYFKLAVGFLLIISVYISILGFVTSDAKSFRARVGEAFMGIGGFPF